MEYRVSAHLPESLLTWGKVKVLDDSVPKAGENCSLEVEVTLDRAIPEDHCIQVWIHFVSDIQVLQTDDESAPAYFSCESDGTEFEPVTYPYAKVHGSGTFFPYRRYAGIRLPDGAAVGSRFVFSFRNVSMQTYEETLFNLRFAVVDGDDVIGYHGDAFYIVKGGSMRFLRIIAPTCVETDQPFDCYIVVCDKYGNKTGEPLDDLSFDLELNSGPGCFSFDEIVYDASKRLHIIQNARFDGEGIHYIQTCVSNDSRVEGMSNPIVVRNQWDEKIYWGDLHQHTYFADGRGTPAANYEYAINTACLDFCAVTPHQERTYAPGQLKIESPVQKGWEELVEAAETYNGQGIVTILGSEAGSLGRVAGHMNSYFLDVDNRPELERLGRLESYQGYLDVLEKSKGEFLLLPHAHARGGPARFDLPILPEYQTNVEICSVHGVFEEFYTHWLEYGHFVGVHAGGDNHMTSTGNGRPGNHYPNTNGLAALFSAEKTRKGVWDAVKHRKTYAVTGNQRIYLNFSINEHLMGSIVEESGTPRNIKVEIAGTAPVLKVELFRNSQLFRTFRPELKRREYLRLVWTDSFCSRRVDDSMTTGRISLKNGELSLVSCLNMFNRTDSFTESGGAIEFRSNGYSGITRGAIIKVLGGTDEELIYEIEDIHLDRTVLKEEMNLSLSKKHEEITRSLNMEDRFMRPRFTNEPHRPEFTLELDWIDPDWPMIACVEWQDQDNSPGYYRIRVEQIDGNIAWSSPIWFLDRR